MVTDVRRRVAYGRQAGATSLKVPLQTPPEGELLEGRITVPARLAHAKPDTNEKHEFDQLINDHLKRWTEWRTKRGWVLNSRPLIRGPFKKATANANEVQDLTEFWYFAIARFKRTAPLYVGLDDMLELQRLATAHGVDLEADRKPWNDLGNEDSGWVDPMKFAEERRRKSGLKRKDYLMGPLGKPRGADFV